MNNKKSVIPNFFTSLNIFCGFLAIINVFDGKVVTASWLIFLAAVFDLLDGQLARLTKSGSDFGIEYDSLADVVSFGVAPSVLYYKAYFESMGILGIIISFFPLLFGSVRLARFNITFGGKEKTKFVGLPIPHAALSCASFIIFNYYFWDEIYLSRIVIPQLLFICILMVSTVEYYTMPKMSFKHGGKNTAGMLLIILLAIILSLFPQETLYLLNTAYILWGVIRYLYRFVKRDGTSKKPKQSLHKE
jgi:CDP-diacylglycerol--serine O-phosphatidyltransferase